MREKKSLRLACGSAGHNPAAGIEEALAENTRGVLHEVELENPVDSLTGQGAWWISVTCNSRLSGIDNAFFPGGVDH